MSFNNKRRGGPRGGFRQQRRPQVSSVDVSKYVNKAVASAPTDSFEPAHSFNDFGLAANLVRNISRHGFESPTPIQDQAIPVLMQGRDVVGIADTGTGKTAAFLLPMINKLIADRRQRILIIAPTRELALQIFEDFKIFSAGMHLRAAICIGGTNINRQIDKLGKNPQVVIGTPGRLKDLHLREVLNTSQFTNIVLDEVDRMLDIGFRRDIEFLISMLPEQKHAAFFSATMNSGTNEIMEQLMSSPVTVAIKKQESSVSIDQDVIKLAPNDSKVDVLHSLLEQDEYERVIVFGRTKRGINKLEKQLSNRGLRVSSIHGNKSQNARQRSLQAFKKGKVQALLATDVVARGIDIDDVTHVINFDEPMTYEDYVHRIGRTGRAGKTGKALTFVCR